MVFDEDRNAVIVDGRDVKLPEPGMRLQQSSAEHDVAYVAGASELMAVPLGGGDARVIESDAAAAPARAADEVAAPVWVNGCAHAAWATSSTYLAACDGREPASQAIEQPTAGSRLEFRVNRDVVVLNDLTNGNAWLVDSDLRLVDNWEEVTPPEETDELEGEEKSAQQTFEDTLAERTDVNRPPLARDDDHRRAPRAHDRARGARERHRPRRRRAHRRRDLGHRRVPGAARGDRWRAGAAVHARRGGGRHGLVPLHGRRRPHGRCRGIRQRAHRARAREHRTHLDAVGGRERRAGAADLLQRAGRLERPRRRRRVPRERLADERRLRSVQPRRLRDVRSQVGRARPEGGRRSRSPTASSPPPARSPSTSSPRAR